MTRRPWKERLVPNCDAISENLLKQYKLETGTDPRVSPKDFLDWLGLKATPTALKRVQAPLIKN